MRRFASLWLAGLAACASPGEPGPRFASPALDATPHWDFSNPAESQRRFVALAQGGQGDLELEAWTQAARADGLLGQFDAARRRLASVEDRLPGAGVSVQVRHALELGRIENSSGAPEASIPHFVRALNLAQDAGLGGLAVDAAHMLGIAEPGEAGLRWTERAMVLAETSQDPSARRWRPTLFNNLGWAEFDAGRPERALAHFERALLLREEVGEQEPIWVARWCVARCLRELGRRAEALAIQRSLRADREAAGSPSTYVLEEILLLER